MKLFSMKLSRETVSVFSPRSTLSLGASSDFQALIVLGFESTFS